MPTSPAVAGWELMLRIREQAKDRGIKAGAICKALDISAPYWSQVANYKGVLGEEKLKTLMDLLDFEPDDQAELIRLRTIAKQRSPFAEYSALFNDTFKRFYNLEAGATSIRSFENTVVPGLLQTENYFEALVQAGALTSVRPTEIKPRIQARLQRQQRLEGPDSLDLSVVIGQAALMNLVGSPQIQREQLEHLRKLSDQRTETLDLRVIPFESGSWVASVNAATFHILEFESARLPCLGWIETGFYGQILDDPNHIFAMEHQHDRIHRIALDRQESSNLIKGIARQLQ